MVRHPVRVPKRSDRAGVSRREAAKVTTYRLLPPLWVAKPRPDLEVEVRPKRRGDGVALHIVDTAAECGDVWDVPDEETAKARALEITGLRRIEWRRPR